MRRFCRTVLILAPYIAWSAFGEEAIAQVLPDKTVRVNGIDIHYLEQGAGVPVVFVHGGLADGRIWELQRLAIAKNYQFISYTRRCSPEFFHWVWRRHRDSTPSDNHLLTPVSSGLTLRGYRGPGTQTTRR